ncbi:uncharacterized protein A4U43_C01F24910 [Asparagus officinalis]|uniref:PIFI-like Ig-like domain-containing protein n=1 Tax=Asparagus officinalis TaxID=4686 RepID=A0A5P1FW38_ASPOF|nr:uncharacterized protein LOC109828799 [Asparagus officinalis]ONK81071.1 uncharacterized protein A4U43_C01F24910 [Asparagus officinalis]
MASTSAFLVSPPLSSRPNDLVVCCVSPACGIIQSGINISRSYLRYRPKRRYFRTVSQASTVAVPPVEETRECSLPTWAEFELGRSPVYWKTMNGLPPTSGEDLTLFYNPAATKLTPNDEYGVAFNGGFNQPIMCGGEPRVMRKKDRGEADLPIYSIKIRAPKHAVNLIFSFTNGVVWDGPYKLQFQIPKAWRNKPTSFFNEGLADELSKEGACAEAIFPDSYVVIESCEIENLYYEGGDRCKLDLVPGCMDPDSPNYDPFANVDDGSCPLESDSEEE